MSEAKFSKNLKKGLTTTLVAFSAGEAPAIAHDRLDFPQHPYIYKNIGDIAAKASGLKARAAISTRSYVRRIGGCESGRPQSPRSRIRFRARDMSPERPSGGYSITIKTWNGYEGYPEAYKAPPSVQTRKAIKLAKEDGGQGKYNHWAGTRWCWDPNRISSSIKSIGTYSLLGFSGLLQKYKVKK